jgi:hypothetical protein
MDFHLRKAGSQKSLELLFCVETLRVSAGVPGKPGPTRVVGIRRGHKKKASWPQDPMNLLNKESVFLDVLKYLHSHDTIERTVR